MHDHEHRHADVSGSRGLAIALVITVVLMAAEIAGGVISNSLALLGDAGHMFTDVFSLGLSLFALRMARRPPNSTRTYGYHRMEVMAALTNGLLLILISIAIFYEAYRRFAAPPEIRGPLMLIIATIGLAGNLASIYVLKDSHTKNLNIRSAFLHIVGDTLSSVGVIVAGVLIIVKHWYFIDPLVSILIGGIIISGAVSIIFESSSILLEFVPGAIDPGTVEQTLAGIQGVKNVHDLHIWAITSGLYAMSAQIMIDDAKISEGALIIQQAESTMKQGFNISHTTIQLECDNCECGMVCSMVTKHERQ